MRNRIIINGRADALHYEIREIVKVANEAERLGQTVTWENIGDPVQKGESVAICLSGRGDKDIDTVKRILGEKANGHP